MTYDLAADLTGLVYVHLNPKNNFLPMLQIRIDWAEPISWMLQNTALCSKKHATLSWPPFYTQLLKKRDLLVASFSDLIEQLGALGLKNLDPRLACNFGFLKGKAIAIDVGNYIYDPIMAKQDNATFVTRLNRCLQKKLEKTQSKKEIY